MHTATSTWWAVVTGPNLSQGDYLPECPIALFGPEYGVSEATYDVRIEEYDCIVLTQSCDLAQNKARFVALCPTYEIANFERANPLFQKRGSWERVRKGRVEGLHLLAPIADARESSTCLVVDFGQIHSLPIEYLKSHASRLGDRQRLQSPYLEHLSQAFARFFMRVGLPTGIPPFK